MLNLLIESAVSGGKEYKYLLFSNAICSSYKKDKSVRPVPDYIGIFTVEVAKCLRKFIFFSLRVHKYGFFMFR